MSEFDGFRQDFNSTLEVEMNEHRVAGTAKNIGGKVQEGVGRVTGNAETELSGLANQVEGTIQDLYGQAREGAESAVHAVREGAVTLEDAFRNTLDSRPYVVVFGAFALGWLLGRTRRPV